MKQKKIYPTEHEEQVRIFEWAALSRGKYPQLDLLFAIPNGSNKSYAQAKKYKAEGLKPGVPDIFLPVAVGDYHGLFVELKRVKGSTTSDEQFEWQQKLNLQMYKSIICYGADEAIQEITNYLNNKHGLRQRDLKKIPVGYESGMLPL